MVVVRGFVPFSQLTLFDDSSGHVGKQPSALKEYYVEKICRKTEFQENIDRCNDIQDIFENIENGVNS